MSEYAPKFDEIVPIAGTTFDFTKAMGTTQEVELPGIWCVNPETGRWRWVPLTKEEAAQFEQAVANTVTIHFTFTE